MSPIKIGVVGLSAEGWAGAAHMTPLLSPPLSNAYTLTAVSTRSSASASTSATKYSELTHQKVTPYHGDTSQIANDPDVDLVMVSVRTPSHKQAALPVIAAGKNLFIEWPCGNGIQESRELLEAAKKSGVKTMAGLQGTQGSAVKKAKEWVSSGKIGRVLSTSVLLSAPEDFKTWGPLVSERNSYSVDEKNGTTMLSIMVGHFISCLLPVLGEFSSVMATTQNQFPTATVVDATGNLTGEKLPQTVPGQVAINGTLKSGAVVSIHCRGGHLSTKGRSAFLWIIDGEKGSIKMESDVLSGSMIQHQAPTLYLDGEQVNFGDTESNLSNTGRAWLEFSKGAEGNYPTLEDAVKVHCVLDAVTRSAKEGRRIEVEQS